MPLSATAIRSAGTRASSSQAAATSIRKVSRSRLFTPMIGAPAASAGRAPRAVCTSTSASSPAAPVAREQRRRPRGRERPHDEQHRGGARGPRLDDLQLVENEILPEHRHRDRGRGRGAQIVDRAAEVGPVGEHRDRRGAMRGVERGSLGGIQILPDRARRGRAPLHLGDDRARARRRSAARERRGRRPASRPRARARAPPAREARGARVGWRPGFRPKSRASCPSARIRVLLFGLCSVAYCPSLTETSRCP